MKFKCRSEYGELVEIEADSPEEAAELFAKKDDRDGDNCYAVEVQESEGFWAEYHITIDTCTTYNAHKTSKMIFSDSHAKNTPT